MQRFVSESLVDLIIRRISAGANILARQSRSRPVVAKPRVRPDALDAVFDKHFPSVAASDIVQPVDRAPVNLLR